jgi:hypothetical protein
MHLTYKISTVVFLGVALHCWSRCSLHSHLAIFPRRVLSPLATACQAAAKYFGIRGIPKLPGSVSRAVWGLAGECLPKGFSWNLKVLGSHGDIFSELFLSETDQRRLDDRAALGGVTPAKTGLESFGRPQALL